MTLEGGARAGHHPARGLDPPPRSRRAAIALSCSGGGDWLLWPEPRADEALLPGMTARVDFLTKSAENVIRVPNAALRFRPATAASTKTSTSTQKHERRGGTVYVLDAKGQPQAIRVQTGISDGTVTQVTGIAEGAKLIVGTVGSQQQQQSAKNAAPFQSGQQQGGGARGQRGGF